jgi:NadR type nicotinamide-nucleotide adenylyltransferase
MGYKIAVVGPESTGKTTLSQQLAKVFQGNWVPEAAREYLNHLPQAYEQQDVERIAKIQFALESTATKDNPDWVFCDTNLLVIKLWMESKYGNCPQWILNEVETNIYDLQILMMPDIGWEYDALRENPDQQSYFFERFKEELIASGRPWIVVGGVGPMRTQNAIEGICSFFKIDEPVVLSKKS